MGKLKLSIYITLLLTFCLQFGYTQVNSKKDILLDITKRYLSDNFIVLKNYDASTINMLATGESVADYIFEYPTIIHEAYHTFNYTINDENFSIRKYRIDDTTTIGINKFSSFPSKRLNNMVPDSLQKKIFRYDTYINSNDTLSGTQQNGFLGILEEFVAYYQSLRACNAVYHYLHDNYNFKNAKIWIDYLGKNESEIYSINEFKLFIAWYLQFARMHHPDIYKKIINDINIKRLYFKIDENSEKEIDLFLKNRITILAGISPYTRMDEGDIYLKGSEAGYGIDAQIEMLYYTNKLLKNQYQNILFSLKK